MARKLNKNVVGILTLLGMGLLAVGGVVLLRNMPGQDPKVYAAEAKRLEEQQKYNEAMQTYYRAYQKDADHDPEYLVKSAKCAVDDGEIASARAFIQQARVKNTKLRSAAELSTKLEFELAQLFGGAMQWNNVLEEAKKLAEYDEQSPLVLQAMGTAYAKLADQDEGNAAKGETALRRAWELDPTNSDVVKVLAAVRWEQAVRKMQERKQKEADALIEDIISMLKSATEKCEEQGNEKAVAELKRERASYQLQSGAEKEGMAALEALAESEKSKADAHILLGRVYLSGIPDKVQSDLDKAERAFKEAIEIDPKAGEGYEFLAQVYGLQRDQTKDPAEREAKLKQQREVYERGLEAIERSKHFRLFQNNQYRTKFISELCLQDVQKAHDADDQDQKAAALKSAEAWVDKLKQEVDLESTSVRLLTAHILNARGDYVAAIREAEAADRVMKGYRDFRLLVLLGDLYTTQKQWGAAKDAYQAALAQSTGIPPMLILRLAQAYLKMDQPAEAMKYLKPAQPRALVEFMDTNQMAIALRAEAYNQLGQPANAAKEAEKLSQGAPDDELLQARILIMRQQNDEAEAKLKAMLEKKPDDMEVIRTLFGFYASNGRSADAKAFTKSLRVHDPKSRDYEQLDLMADGLVGELADERVIQFLEQEPDEFRRALNLADFHFSRQKFEIARKYLDQAEQKKQDDPACVDRQFRLGLLTKDWEHGEKYAAKNAALNLDGTEGKLAYGRLAMAKADAERTAGHAEAAQAEYQRAIDLLSIAVQKFPKNAMAWTNLAEAYGDANRASEAKETLKQALQVDPTNGYANRALAAIAINENDEKTAETYLRAAAKALPNDSWVRERLRIIGEKANPSEGIASREKTRKEKPEDIENLVLLARLYGDAKVAEFDKAAAMYLEALKLSQQNADQKKTNNDLQLAREIAGFYGREDVNKPADGEGLLDKLMKEEESKSCKALIAVFLGQFYESQKTMATADRYFRMAVSFDPSPEVLTMAAEFCSRSNQMPQSLEFYERVVKAEDNAGYAKVARARMIALLLTLADMDRAKEQIDAYVKAYPEDPQGMVYEGAYHRMGGDIQKAKQAFDAFLEKNPSNALALWQRGQLYMLLGKWEAAIADLKNAKTYSKDGFGFQHRIALADALLQAGKGDEAAGELRSILDERPDELAVAEALVEAYTKLVPPRFADAETLVYSKMRDFPKDPRWPKLLGRLGELAQDWNKAIAGYEKAVEISRYQPETVTALFQAYKNAGRPQDIIRYATEKLTSRTFTNAPEALSSLAWAYSKTNDDSKCLETYDQALAAAGEDVVRATRVTSDMVRTLGKETALARAKSRAEADPANPDRKKVLVHLLFVNDKPEEALEVCREVGKLALNNGDSVFAELGEAMLLERLNRYPEAKAKYEAGLKLDPNNALALNNLAFLLTDKLDNAAEALPYAERAKKLSPDDPNVLDTYGMALAKKGRPGEALGVLLRALDINRDNVSVLYHLGLVHQQRGELEDAKARFLAAKGAAEAEEAARPGAKSPELPKINEALQRLEKTGA